MKLFIQLLLPAFLLLASCEYKKIDLESEEDFQFRSSIDTDVCNWLVDEKLISVNQEKFDINVIKRSKKGSQPDISDSLQNDAVNLKGNCSDSNRHVIVKLSGDLYYETPNALYSRHFYEYEIRIDASGISEHVTHSGSDTWKPSYQTESYTASYERLSMTNSGITFASGILVISMSGEGRFMSSSTGAKLGYSPYSQKRDQSAASDTDIALNIRSRTWDIQQNSGMPIYNGFKTISAY